MCTPRRFHPEAFKFGYGDEPPGRKCPSRAAGNRTASEGRQPEDLDGGESGAGTAEERDESLLRLELSVALALLSEAETILAAQKPDATKALDLRLEKAERRAARRVHRATRRALSEAMERHGASGGTRTRGGLMVVEVTARVRGGQFLLRPDQRLNEVVAGVIGRAQAETGVRIGALHVLSNHLSMVVAVRSPAHLADFANRVFGQLADRVGRLRGLRVRMWGRRNRSIVVDGNATDVGKCLKYCLSNGTKENLVAHPSQWPGLHSARVFVLGERMMGKWTDYTGWGAAKRRDPAAREADFQTEYEVVHSKMPCFEHLTDEAHQEMLRGWCDEAAADAAAERTRLGLPAPGDPKRLSEVPFEHIPDDVSCSRAPAVHAHEPTRQKLFRQLMKAAREHQQAARESLAAHASLTGLDLGDEGIPPTGWRPVDPATVEAPPPIHRNWSPRPQDCGRTRPVGSAGGRCRLVSRDSGRPGAAGRLAA